MTLDPAVAALLARAQQREKYAVARLISLFEEETEAARATRVAILEALAAQPARRAPALVVGLTGAPGSGKSTLIGKLALALAARDPALSVAVLAIDPSSADSGGALLGDRVRTEFPVGEPRLYFRSQAAGGDLGGVGRRTFAATRALAPLFDVILVETVGIGQSEIDIRRLAHRVLLVLAPLGGDHVQFLKAGVMEIPDAFVISKCDEESLARRAHGELRAALRSSGLGRAADAPILKTSAQSGTGIDALADWILAERAAAGAAGPDGERAREQFFLRREVVRAYGEWGARVLGELAAAGKLPPPGGPAWFDQAEHAALAALAARAR